MATPFDSQQGNTAARPSGSDLKRSIALTKATLSTINKTPLSTHIEHQRGIVNENTKRDNLSDGETLVNDREGPGGIP